LYTVNKNTLKVKDRLIDCERSEEYEEMLPVNIAKEI